MSNVTVLQTAANRFSKVAGFTPIAVDGAVGSQTLNAVQRALDYVAVVDENSGVSETVSDQAAAWSRAASTISQLNTNAQPIGGYLSFVADLMKLGYVASPIIPSGGMTVPPPITLPIVAASGGVLVAWRALPTWQKIAFSALAGFLAIFLHGKYIARSGKKRAA